MTPTAVVVAAAVGSILVSLLAVVAGGWKFSKLILGLQFAIERLADEFHESKPVLTKHGETIANHETRISVLEELKGNKS